MTNKQSNTNQAPSATKELYTKQPTRNKDFPMKKKQNECLRTDDENHLHVQKPIKHDQTHDRLKDDINAQTSTMANDTVDDHVPVRDPDANESGVADTTRIVPATQELLVQQTIGIITPHPHDVLSGRGAGVNHHPGNAHYRNLVKNYKMEYFRSPAPAKKQIIQVIVDKIVGKNPPGRFIRTDPKTELWECIPIEQAKKKTGQALREDAAKLKKMKLIQQYYGGLVACFHLLACYGTFSLVASACELLLATNFFFKRLCSMISQSVRATLQLSPSESRQIPSKHNSPGVTKRGFNAV